MKRFSAYYVEAQPGDGAGDAWIPLEHCEYSPLRPSGYRARIEWMLGYTLAYGNARTRAAQHDEMARWYVRRYAELHPDAAPLQAVRFVRVAYPVGEGTPGAPGNWEAEPLERIPRDRRQILFTYRARRDD